MNPYFGKDFLSFFPLFFCRLFQLATGSLSWRDLAPDEIQLFVLTLVCISSTLVGSLLILKKMTMLANSISHTILLGIVTSTLLFSSGEVLAINFKVLMAAALITGLLTTLLTQLFHRVMRLQEDASIGLVFSALFALGIVLVTLYTRNTHIGVEVVMGNADALHLHDLNIAFWVAVANSVALLLFFKEWKLICFDQSLAKSLGFRPGIFNLFLMLLTSGTSITAFRAVGVILFLAFLVGLPLTARLITANLRSLLLISIGLGGGCSLVAVALSRHLLTACQMPLSTAGLTVTLVGLVFALILGIKHWFLKPLQS